MKCFAYLYQKVIQWSAHRHAPYYLAGVSFTESCVFPIPPDVMLASMTLAKRENAWRYALITTLFSVAGGVLGYFIGKFLLQLLWPYMEYLNYVAAYEQVRHLFDEWGVWIVVLAGFTPIPYKIFTLTAGAMGMLLLPFILASFVGRGARFFLVAALLYYGGPKIDRFLRQYIDRLGWLMLLLTLAVYATYRLLY